MLVEPPVKKLEEKNICSQLHVEITLKKYGISPSTVSKIYECLKKERCNSFNGLRVRCDDPHYLSVYGYDESDGEFKNLELIFHISDKRFDPSPLLLCGTFIIRKDKYNQPVVFRKEYEGNKLTERKIG